MIKINKSHSDVMCTFLCDMCSEVNDMVMIYYQFAMNAARMNSWGGKQITKNALNYSQFNIFRY